MLSWRRVLTRRVDADGIFMSLLRDDDRIAWRASPEAAVVQLTLKVDECFHRDPRRTEFHAGADDRVQHPVGQHRDNAGRRLNENQMAGGARLAPHHPDAAAMQRVPAVMDVNILPGMGTMDVIAQGAGQAKIGFPARAREMA